MDVKQSLFGWLMAFLIPTLKKFFFQINSVIFIIDFTMLFYFLLYNNLNQP